MKAITTKQFQALVRQHYAQNKRDLPWRRNVEPYPILISEMMLQQTQVNRVILKFDQFLIRFPDIQTLAAAPLSEVLKAWSGLGYNRRAKYLWQTARMIEADFSGDVPADLKSLITLPGVGRNTAAAILNYAFNKPTAFIETNIRTVYLHHFFKGQNNVSDKELLTLVEQTLDHIKPREWFWALMDYGTYLKTIDNNIVRSKHYKKQSKFAGSLRQMRGRILKILIDEALPEAALAAACKADERFLPALKQLQNEGLVTKTGSRWHLT